MAIYEETCPIISYCVMSPLRNKMPLISTTPLQWTCMCILQECWWIHNLPGLMIGLLNAVFFNIKFYIMEWKGFRRKFRNGCPLSHLIICYVTVYYKFLCHWRYGNCSCAQWANSLASVHYRRQIHRLIYSSAWNILHIFPRQITVCATGI